MVQQVTQPSSPLENKSLVSNNILFRESCGMDAIEVYWIPGEENPADIQTELLSVSKFIKHFKFLMCDNDCL